MKLFLYGIIYSISLLDIGFKVPDVKHAIYVSVLEIAYSTGMAQGSLQVKVFANDLEDAIYHHSKIHLDLQNGKCEQGPEAIIAYFEDHLRFKIDGKLQKIANLSCEVNDISIWLTFDFLAPENWGRVEVKADYLMELFPTQSNIVSITYQAEKRMFRLTQESGTKTINF